MIKSKTLKTLEYDKILAEIAKLTVLNETKHLLLNYNPETDFFAVKLLLQKTEEAKILLYNYGVKSIEYFDEIVDEFERAKKASVLSMKELLNIAKLLRSSRIASILMP